MEHADEEAQGSQVLSPEERLKIFNEVNRMVKSSPQQPIGMNAAGQSDSKQTAEFVQNLEELDISGASEGDIVWWQTDNSRNYFLVSKPNELRKELVGSFQSFANDDQEGRAYDSAVLKGAGVRGGILIPGVLKKGMSVLMNLPKESSELGPPKEYQSSPARNFGAITPTPSSQEVL